MYKIVISLFLFSVSVQSFGAISGYHEGKITTISYEADRGIIRIDKSFNDSGCTGAYADLKDEGQRVAFSTALAAKMASAKVRIRVVVDGVDYYTNCKVFEVSILP